MANAPITKPTLFQALNPDRCLRPSKGDASATFEAQQFVLLTSGSLATYVADDVAIYGLTEDGSKTATTEPYDSLYSQNHNVIDPTGCTFIMNITDASGTVGSGSTTQADVTVGTRYSARYLASPYTTTLGIDAADSGTATKNLFQVTGLVAADASTDYNGRVYVKVIASAIQ